MIRSSSENRLSSTVKFKLEDFKVIGELGKGSFSVVKLVYHKFSKKKFALKIINMYHLQKNDKQHYINIEKNILSYLKVDKVVELIETFKDENNLYFLLEHLPKGDFFKFMSLYKVLDEEKTKYFIIEILNILVYLHSLGIIHRDIKPSNLLVTEDFHLKIIDFGTAKIFPNEKNEYLISMIKKSFNKTEDNEFSEWRRKSLSGTFNYISPEVLNSKNYSFAADYWALGIITHKMLTNKFPIKYVNNLKNEFKFNIDKSLSKDAKDFIEKLLEIDPSKRIKTAIEVISHPFIRNMKEFYPNFKNEKIKIFIRNQNLFCEKFKVNFLFLFKKLKMIKLNDKGILKIMKINNKKIYQKFFLTKNSQIEIKNFQIIIKNENLDKLKIEPDDGNFIKYFRILKNLIDKL